MGYLDGLEADEVKEAVEPPPSTFADKVKKHFSSAGTPFGGDQKPKHYTDLLEEEKGGIQLEDGGGGELLLPPEKQEYPTNLGDIFKDTEPTALPTTATATTPVTVDSVTESAREMYRAVIPATKVDSYRSQNTKPNRAMPLGADISADMYAGLQHSIANIDLTYTDPVANIEGRYVSGGIIRKSILTTREKSRRTGIDIDVGNVYVNQAKAEIVIGKSNDYQVANSLGVSDMDYLIKVEEKNGYITDKMAEEYRIPKATFGIYKGVASKTMKTDKSKLLSIQNIYSTVDEGVVKGASPIQAQYEMFIEQGNYGDANSEDVASFSKNKDFKQLTAMGLTPRQAVRKLVFESTVVTDDEVTAYKELHKDSEFLISDSREVKHLLRRTKAFKRELTPEDAESVGIDIAMLKQYNEDVWNSSNRSGAEEVGHAISGYFTDVSTSLKQVFGYSSAAAGAPASFIAGAVNAISEAATGKYTANVTPTSDRKNIRIYRTEGALDEKYGWINVNVPKQHWSFGDGAKFILDYHKAGGKNSVTYGSLKDAGIPQDVVNYLYRKELLFSAAEGVDSANGMQPMLGISPLAIAPVEAAMFAGVSLLGMKAIGYFGLPSLAKKGVYLASQSRQIALSEQEAMKKVLKAGEDPRSVRMSGKIQEGDARVITPATHTGMNRESLGDELYAQKLAETVEVKDFNIGGKSETLNSLHNIFTRRTVAELPEKQKYLLGRFADTVIGKGNAKQDAEKVQKVFMELETAQRASKNASYKKISEYSDGKKYNIADMQQGIESALFGRTLTRLGGKDEFFDIGKNYKVGSQIEATTRRELLDAIYYQDKTIPKASIVVMKKHQQQLAKVESLKGRLSGTTDYMRVSHDFATLKNSVANPNFLVEATAGLGMTVKQTAAFMKAMKPMTVNKISIEAKKLFKLSRNELARGTKMQQAKHKLISKYSGLTDAEIRTYAKNSVDLKKKVDGLTATASSYKGVTDKLNNVTDLQLVEMVKRINSLAYSKVKDGDNRKRILLDTKNLISKYARKRLADKPKLLAQWDDANNNAKLYHKYWGGTKSKSSTYKSTKALGDMVARKDGVLIHNRDEVFDNLTSSPLNTKEILTYLRGVKTTSREEKVVIGDVMQRVRSNFLEKQLGFKSSYKDVNVGNLSGADTAKLSSKLDGMLATKGDESYLRSIVGNEVFRDLKALHSVTKTVERAAKTMEDPAFNRLAGGIWHYIKTDKDNTGIMGKVVNTPARTLRVAMDLTGHIRNGIIDRIPGVRNVVRPSSLAFDWSPVNILYSGAVGQQIKLRSLQNYTEARLRASSQFEGLRSYYNGIYKGKKMTRTLENRQEKFVADIASGNKKIARLNKETELLTADLKLFGHTKKVMAQNGITTPAQLKDFATANITRLQKSELRATSPEMYADEMTHYNKLLMTAGGKLDKYGSINEALVEVRKVAKATKANVGNEERHILHLGKAAEANQKRVKELKQKHKLFTPTPRFLKLQKMFTKYPDKVNKTIYAEWIKEGFKSIPNPRLRKINRELRGLDEKIDNLYSRMKEARRATTGESAPTGTQASRRRDRLWGNFVFNTGLGAGFSYGMYTQYQRVYDSLAEEFPEPVAPTEYEPEPTMGIEDVNETEELR